MQVRDIGISHRILDGTIALLTTGMNVKRA